MVAYMLVSYIRERDLSMYFTGDAVNPLSEEASDAKVYIDPDEAELKKLFAAARTYKCRVIPFSLNEQIPLVPDYTSGSLSLCENDSERVDRILHGYWDDEDAQWFETESPPIRSQLTYVPGTEDHIQFLYFTPKYFASKYFALSTQAVPGSFQLFIKVWRTMLFPVPYEGKPEEYDKHETRLRGVYRGLE